MWCVVWPPSISPLSAGVSRGAFLFALPGAPLYRVTFVSGLFGGRKNRELSNANLGVLLSALTEINVLELNAYPHIPDLYTSGVRYENEPVGVEDWTDILTTISRGYGDCEDLACWRAAELRVRHGIDARPYFSFRKVGPGKTLYHIQVAYPDGRIEDPSKALGMGLKRSPG